MPGAAPAPHAMAAGRDYDFDCYKPFFYDEDCTWDCNQSTAPSEDIWKKFELLPTLPLSPNRARLMLLLPSGDPCYGNTADSLDNDIESRSFLLDPVRHYGGGGRSSTGAVVLRDCMWSGLPSARATPDKFVREKSAAKKFGGLPGSAGSVSLLSTCLPAVSRAVPLEPSPCGGSPREGGRVGVGGAGPCSASLVVTSAVVDPAEMLPFGPGGQHLLSEGQGQGDEEEDGEMTENGAMSPSNETPSDSEDGEIDVVTVESMSVRTVYNTTTARQCNQQQQQRSATAHASRGHIPPVLQQHNYAAPSPENPPAAKSFRPDAPPTVAPAPPPPGRGATQSRRGGFSRAVSSRADSTGCGTPRSSGSKYRVKRYLERQRRYDIKNSFLWLRDLIPELAHNDKAGRVLILRKAMEYSSTLQRQKKQLKEKKQQLKIQQQELLKRLEIVRNSQAERS